MRVVRSPGADQWQIAWQTECNTTTANHPQGNGPSINSVGNWRFPLWLVSPGGRGRFYHARKLAVFMPAQLDGIAMLSRVFGETASAYIAGGITALFGVVCLIVAYVSARDAA